MKEITEIFLDLVKIASPSRKEQEVAAYIKNHLRQYPEVTVVEDNAGSGNQGNSGNLIVRVAGPAPHLLFDAHMDTVTPCEPISPKITDGVIQSDRTSILGADDKSGVALMLALLDVIMRQKIPHPALTFLFSVCEEEGLKGAKLLENQYLQPVDYAFVLDGEGPVGTAVVQTPHGCKGTLRIVGKEAHAGVCPEKGINALVVASQAISQLDFGRIDEDTTCNIGIVRGGSATNVVMGAVDLQFEARSYDLEKLQQLIAGVKKTFSTVAESKGAIFEESLKYGTPGYFIPEQAKILNYFQKACQKAAITYQRASCGGGSNANVYRNRGIEAVNLSTDMSNIHSLQESITVKALADMLVVLTHLVMMSAFDQD